MRRKNLNALERMEREEVRVAGDDAGRTPTHSKFEELVVLRITAGRYPCIHIDPLSLACQSRQKHSNIFLIDILPEPLSAHDFVEFGERCKGQQNFTFSERQIKSLAWLRIGQKQCANQDVRIEDAPQLCAFKERIQNLRRESSGLGLPPDLFEYLL